MLISTGNGNSIFVDTPARGTGVSISLNMGGAAPRVSGKNAFCTECFTDCEPVDTYSLAHGYSVPWSDVAERRVFLSLFNTSY